MNWPRNLERWIPNKILVCETENYRISFPSGTTAPSGPGPSNCRGFTITLRHTTLGSSDQPATGTST
jgi:hypothetical protein